MGPKVVRPEIVMGHKMVVSPEIVFGPKMAVGPKIVMWPKAVVNPKVVVGPCWGEKAEGDDTVHVCLILWLN
jgi:UDP-3-O-[3-hydroxymyristoyl] glucosamine N-acyltransferase